MNLLVDSWMKDMDSIGMNYSTKFVQLANWRVEGMQLAILEQ